MKLNYKHEKYFFIVCLALIVFLLFFNLGDRFIGATDEAYTALRVKEILTSGYSSDLQVSLVTLPYLYLTSLSVKIFGLDQFSIRLVPALFGVIFVIIYFFFLKKFVTNRKTRIMAFLLIVVSTVFYLHARFGRYYSMLMVFSLLTVYYFIDFLKNGKSKMPFIASSIILFYTHAEVGLYLLLSLFIFSLLERKKDMRSVMSSFFFIAIFSLPLIIVWLYFRQTITPFSPLSNLSFLFMNIAAGIFYMLVFFLPPAIIVLGLCIVKKNKISLKKLSVEYRLLLFLIVSVLLLSSIFGVIGPISIRKLMVLLPFTAILTAAVISHLFSVKKNTLVKFLGLAILIALIFTNFINIIPLNFTKNVDLGSYAPKDVTDRFLSRSLQPRFYFFDYFYEITHHYESSTQVVVTEILKNYNKNDSILVFSEYISNETLILYLGGSSDNILNGNRLSGIDKPYNCIIIDNITGSNVYDPKKYTFNTSDYNVTAVHNHDFVWSDFPDPVHHRFLEEENGYILIYRKI